MRKEKKAVKNQNIFLNEISHALRTILVMNNIGLNLGIRPPRIQTYIAKNSFIILLFYRLASETSCNKQHKIL